MFRSGGAEQFIPGSGSPNGTDYYKAFQAKGYKVVYNNTELKATGNKDKTLGIFSGGFRLLQFVSAIDHIPYGSQQPVSFCITWVVHSFMMCV